MYSTVLGICLLMGSVSCMTIWKPDMQGNKYKMKDVVDRADALNNALSLDRLNEIPELTKSSTVTNKDRTYTRTVVQKTYSRDDAKTSTFRTLEGKENIQSQNNLQNAKEGLTARKSEFFPRVSAAQKDIEIRKSESVPPLSLSTRRVITSKTSPAISSKTITTRTSSVQSQPQKTTRRVVKTSSVSDTIPLFSSLSKFATRSESAPMKHISTSTVTKTTKSGPSSRSVSSKSSSFHRDIFTEDRSQLRKSTVGDDTSFRRDTGIAAPSGQQREFLSSIQTGIQIPTSTKISTSEFSSSSGSFTNKRRLPSSQSSDFTIITVKERLPASSSVNLISNRSTNRKTTSDRSTAYSSQAGSQLTPPTFIASSMTNSVRSSQLSNEATIASPELMPVTAGGAGSTNMMENMIAASIATGNEVKVVERAAEVVEGAQEVAGNVIEGAQEVAGNVVEGAQEVAGNVIEGAQEVAGNVVEGAQEAAGNLMEAASNVGENMAEAGENVVENMAEGVEKGVEMVNDVAENVAERVEDVIDDGSLPNPLLSTGRGDTDDNVNIRTKDDKDSRSREIGAVRLDGDSGEDSDGDGNSDSEEEGSTTFNRVGAQNRRRDSNSGEDSNGDGDSDSEEWGDGSYARRQRDSNSGEDSNGDGDSDSEERRGGRRRGSRRGRWWRRGGRGSDSSADSGSSNQASDSSDESRDGDRDDSGSDSSSSDSMEDDFDYFEDMNDFWMNGGFTKSSSRRNLPSISTSELTRPSSSRSKIAPNVDLQSSTSGSNQASVSPGYQRGDMRRIISQIKNNGGAVISLPEAKTNTMVHFFVKWRKSNLSRKGQKMFIRTPEATVAILRHPNRRRS